MEFNWPLNVSQFNTWDKCKLAYFILTNDRWTQGAVVKQFEDKMAKYVGVNHAVFTSSGSTANTILAMYLKDTMPKSKNVVVCPSTTWITSVAPFMREGFKIQFIDISLEDFNMDLKQLDDFLRKNASSVACVFLTSLLGFTPNISVLKMMEEKYDVKIMLDNCENTLGSFLGFNVSSFFTSTTSTYFGHQIQSIEGGFIFTNNIKEYDYCIMARNHGMVRGLDETRRMYYKNYDVDSRFDFAILGSDFRNTNINAFIGMMNLEHADEYLQKRSELYHTFAAIMGDYLILPNDKNNRYSYIQYAPFCLPIVLKPEYAQYKNVLQHQCGLYRIETRPIISGNLLRQTCFYQEDYAKYVNSEYLHHNGFYVGLNSSVTSNDIYQLCGILLKNLLSKL